MPTALVIGGTGFVGRNVVAEFLDADYDVGVLSRGTRPPPPIVEDRTTYIEGGRSEAATLETASDRIDPDVVIDCALFSPDDAGETIHTFADVDAYVYVSSGGVYAGHEIPKREDTTPLHEFSEEQADDNTMATYGPRKAEIDRLVRGAADDGVAALVVRPTMIYGPKTLTRDETPADPSPAWANIPGIQTHHDYWIDRVDRFDRVLVPGDGTAIWHRVYVEDVASACRIVAEEGIPGEAYNAAERRVFTMEDVIELIAETLGTSIEVVHASERELAAFDLDPDEFVLYHHLGSRYPHVLSTCKLARLGWSSTPADLAMERTVEESISSDRSGQFFDPGRDREEQAIIALTA